MRAASLPDRKNVIAQVAFNQQLRPTRHRQHAGDAPRSERIPTLAVALEQTGAYREAANEWTQAHAVALAGRDVPVQPMPPDVALVLRTAGTPEGYRAFLRKRLEWEEKAAKGPVGSSSIAILHARLGDRDAAFRWLERSFESRTRDLIYLKVEPAYDVLRGDPRFATLLRDYRSHRQSEAALSYA